MTADEPAPRPSLFELIAANAAAGGVRAVLRAAVPRYQPEPVPCPRCQTVLALWLPLFGGSLWERARGGQPALRLGNGACKVELRCGGCGRKWHTSGRSVARRLRKGQPLVGDPRPGPG